MSDYLTRLVRAMLTGWWPNGFVIRRTDDRDPKA
jgi:hypothetical protein